MFEILAIGMLLIPAALSTGLSWVLIRRSHATAGVFGGLSVIVVTPVIDLIAIRILIEQCTVTCQQRSVSPESCEFGCGEGNGPLFFLGLFGILISAVIYPASSSILLRHYKGRLAWPKLFLTAVGIVSILISIGRFAEVIPHIGSLSSVGYAFWPCEIAIGGLLGIGVLLLVLHQVKKDKAERH